MRSGLLFSAIAILACTTREVAAQTIHGEVVEEGTANPIEGVFIVLMDEQMNRHGAVLTDRAGRFIIRTAAPGRYHLRAERIGHETMISPLLDVVAGQTLTYRFEITARAIELKAITVETASRCRVPRAVGAETQRLWDEARKALEIVAWLDRRGVAYQTASYERVRDLLSLELRDSQVRIRSGYSREPFHSQSAEDLAIHGYVRRSADDTFLYFGLDAPTLLSDAFLDTHCFRARPPGDGQDGLIGLAFEPLPGHRLPDITGVLWLDQATSELRNVEFEFTQHLLDITVPRATFGGRVDFQRLANGAWIVKRWSIRMPQLTMTRRQRAPTQFSGGSERDLLRWAARAGLSVKEDGGEVRFLGLTSSAAELGDALLEGMVYDSARAMPLSGATVFLTGTQHYTTTRGDGSFRFTRVPAGLHEIGFLHPLVDSLGLMVSPRQIVLARAERARVVLSIPQEQGCPIEEDRSRDGALVGFVQDVRNGDPVAGAEAMATWQRKRAARRGFEDGEQHRVAISDENGRFLLCAIPVGEKIRVGIRSGGKLTHIEALPAVESVIEKPGIAQQAFLVTPTSR